MERLVAHLVTGEWGGVGGRKDGVGHTVQGRAVAAVTGSRFAQGNSVYHYGTETCVVDHVPFGAYSVEVARQLGGWSETQLVNEDFEFDYRLRRAGHRLLFDPAAAIDWDCRQSVVGAVPPVPALRAREGPDPGRASGVRRRATPRSPRTGRSARSRGAALGATSDPPTRRCARRPVPGRGRRRHRDHGTDPATTALRAAGSPLRSWRCTSAGASGSGSRRSRPCGGVAGPARPSPRAECPRCGRPTRLA